MVVGPTAGFTELLTLYLLPDARQLREETARWVRAKGHRKEQKDSAQQPHSPVNPVLTEISEDRSFRHLCNRLLTRGSFSLTPGS